MSDSELRLCEHVARFQSQCSPYRIRVGKVAQFVKAFWCSLASHHPTNAPTHLSSFPASGAGGPGQIETEMPSVTVPSQHCYCCCCCFYYYFVFVVAVFVITWLLLLLLFLLHCYCCCFCYYIVIVVGDVFVMTLLLLLLLLHCYGRLFARSKRAYAYGL